MINLSIKCLALIVEMKYIPCLIVAIFTFFASCGAAKGNTYEPVVGHPRLLLHKGDEVKVTETLERIHEIKSVHDSIIRLCDRMVKWSPLERKLTGVRLLDVSREALRRIFYLSYGYRMTGNRKYSERAIKEMLNVCSFSDWNPSHFLDVGEMTMAVAIGFDWLYDNISEENKKTIENAVREKAFTPSKNNKYNYFYRRAYNWNQVCNAGLLYGAIAFKDELPEEADNIITRCLESNPQALDTYLPNGGYPEGYGYWSYGTTSEVLLIDGLLTAFGTDFGIIPPTGFLETSKFMTFMTAPSGKCFNFSDTGDKSHGNIASWWLAAYTGDTSVLGEEIKYLSSPNFNVGELRLLPALPIFASRLDNIGVSKMTVHYWLSNGTTPVFIYRSGWDNTNDTYLGVKGGSPSTTHAHMDAGSFVYEYDSVRWAVDLGLQSYYSLESKGVKLWNSKQDGQRWDILRMRNDYHNTLTIDDRLHNVDSNAMIVDTFTNINRKGALVDLTATLGKVKKAHREVSLDQYDYLTVIDSIECDKSGINLKWNMVTPANARIHDNNNIILEKDGRTMVLSLHSSIKARFRILSNAPIHDYDEPNPGTVRVGFEADIPAHTKATFKVQLAPEETVTLSH